MKLPRDISGEQLAKGLKVFGYQVTRHLDFLRLYSGARLVLTDSGGIQEETTVLGIPCLTLRENTERPITVTVGTNKIVGANPEKIVSEALAALDEKSKTTHRIPPLWDGHTAERILGALIQTTISNRGSATRHS